MDTFNSRLMYVHLHYIKRVNLTNPTDDGRSQSALISSLIIRFSRGGDHETNIAIQKRTAFHFTPVRFTPARTKLYAKISAPLTAEEVVKASCKISVAPTPSRANERRREENWRRLAVGRGGEKARSRES